MAFECETGCSFCGGVGLDVCNWHDPRITENDFPSAARVVCRTCGATGPRYQIPLVWLKTEPNPAWDPRERAIAAWDGNVNPDGLEFEPMWPDYLEDC